MAWKKLKSGRVYDNDWIAVYEDQVINPRGGHNIYGRVHFKNTAIGIIPISRGGDTWLVGQDRYTLGEYSWEIPMGGGPLDEPPLTAAKRELLEETGLSAEHWTEIMHLTTSNSITDERGIVFVAEDLTAGATDFGETEVLEIRRLPFREALSMVHSGAITDAISVAGLLKVAASRK